MAKQKSKRQGEQVASLRLPVGFQPSPACTKVYPTYTGLHKSVPYNREKVWTESPPVQDIQTLPDFKARMDAPWVDHSGGEKYGALRGGEQK